MNGSRARAISLLGPLQTGSQHRQFGPSGPGRCKLRYELQRARFSRVDQSDAVSACSPPDRLGRCRRRGHQYEAPRLPAHSPWSASISTSNETIESQPNMPCPTATCISDRDEPSYRQRSQRKFAVFVVPIQRQKNGSNATITPSLSRPYRRSAARSLG